MKIWPCTRSQLYGIVGGKVRLPHLANFDIELTDASPLGCRLTREPDGSLSRDHFVNGAPASEEALRKATDDAQDLDVLKRKADTFRMSPSFEGVAFEFVDNAEG